ncbi:hypothetical protein [Mangrovicoccus sp. HB161399]|uniref:hypothetical protein n=1 Tax=Mangrovicoccus sp. HB161399 TaxID=2720392 RepID=UPI001552AD20|nr:hypothetical protein [Mangrovicoccus sp. HB161399]
MIPAETRVTAYLAEHERRAQHSLGNRDLISELIGPEQDATLTASDLRALLTEIADLRESVRSFCQVQQLNA